MGRMDGEGLVHDEKKGVNPLPPPKKKRREKRANRKKERALKNLESRAIFTGRNREKPRNFQRVSGESCIAAVNEICKTQQRQHERG